MGRVPGGGARVQLYLEGEGVAGQGGRSAPHRGGQRLISAGLRINKTEQTGEFRGRLLVESDCEFPSTSGR